MICDDALYTRALGWFNSLKQPAMFVPGDNDWTDCDRPSNGGFNSLERLDHERSVFFSTSRSLGAKTMEQEVQSTPAVPRRRGPTACVENRRWTLKGVTYATLNVQGSCNNLCDTAPNPAEYAARNAANIAWLDETFDEATADGLGGGDADHPGRRGLRRLRRHPRPAPRPEDARGDGCELGPPTATSPSCSSCGRG